MVKHQSLLCPAGVGAVRRRVLTVPASCCTSLPGLTLPKGKTPSLELCLVLLKLYLQSLGDSPSHWSQGGSSRRSGCGGSLPMAMYTHTCKHRYMYVLVCVFVDVYVKVWHFHLHYVPMGYLSKET